jgi:hypothetical protein
MAYLGIRLAYINIQIAYLGIQKIEFYSVKFANYNHPSITTEFYADQNKIYIQYLIAIFGLKYYLALWLFNKLK